MAWLNLPLQAAVHDAQPPQHGARRICTKTDSTHWLAIASSYTSN